MVRLRHKKEHQPDFENLQFVVLKGAKAPLKNDHHDQYQQQQWQQLKHPKPKKIDKSQLYLKRSEPGPMEKAFLAGRVVQKVKGADENDLMLLRKGPPPLNPPRTAAELLQNTTCSTACIEVVDPEAEGFEGVPFSVLDPEQHSDEKETTKGLLLQWLRTIESQQATFTSSLVWADCILTQIQRATSKLSQPNLFQSSASALLLTTVCNGLVSKKLPEVARPLTNLLNRLLNQICASIFNGWGDCVDPFQNIKEGNLDQVFCNLSLYATSTSKVQKELSDYKKDVIQMNAEAEAERQRKTTIMLGEVQMWKKQLLLRLFRAWRSESKNAKKSRTAVNMVIDRMTSRLQHFVTWTAFLLLRNHAKETKWHKELQVHNSNKRDWRLRQTTLQLEVSELKTEVVRNRKEYTYQLEDITRQQEAKILELETRIKDLEEQVTNHKLQTAGMSDKFDDMTRDRDRWLKLCNEILYSITGEIQDREHPHFALLTDKCKRQREISTLEERITATKASTPSINTERLLSRLTQQLDVLKKSDFEYLSIHKNVSEILDKNRSSEHILLSFCNFILDKEGIYRSTEIENFTTDFQDSEVFVVLLHVLWPEKCSLSPLMKTNHQQRAMSVVESLHGVGLRNIISVDDILVGRCHRVFILTSLLFSKYCLSQAIGSFGEKGALALRDPTNTKDDEHTEPLPHIETSYERMCNKFGLLRDTMKGWLYLHSKVVLCGYKHLQNGRTREGEVTDLKERRRKATYTFLDEDKLADAFSSSANPRNSGDEMDLCEDLLSLHYWDIRSVYLYYCCLDAGLRMSTDSFITLLNDCQVLKQLGRRTLESCFEKAFRGQPDKTISPQRFSELIVRVGGEHAMNSKSSQLPLSEGVRLLVEDAILPRASRSGVESFRYSLKQLTVQRVLKKNQKVLQRGFRVYVTGISKVNESSAIGYDEFQKFIRDCKLTDVNFTFADALHIYTNIMCDETKVVDIGMTYSEWLDAITCIAVHKHPTPLAPLHQRLDLFLDSWLLPKLRERIRQGIKQ